MTDNAQVLTAYAQYFVKWVQGYSAQGITIESVGPQNEPNYFDNYPSCGWSSALFTKFVGQYLGPAFTSANMATKIMLGTMSNANSGIDPSIVSAVLADATAKSYIKLFGYQWNMEPNVASAKSSNCSQFVSVGAKVVATSGGDAIAFKNPDGNIVAIMYNSGGATPYTLPVGGKKLQFAMPANGWATVDYVP